ncbi:MAG: 3-isopropylmalate dehydratase small subunit [Alphaproteobacteria bacterium]|nr:3-isopropylmalate dehydratase small subunit [Alphaproteobacteria bacterium]
MAVDKFTRLEGVAAPLMRSNVDTDVVIRIQRLVELPRDELGPYCFESIRYRPDGSENPDFIGNEAAYRGAPILLAADNFGCGSSREGAVWALMGMGVRAVIAPSYGDIFFNNCFQNGLLPVVLPLAEIERLAEETRAAPGNARVTIDLERQVVVSPRGREVRFEIEPKRRHAMLNGLDDIGVTLTHRERIAAWQAKDKTERPWVWLSGAAR